jgi:2-polyprenyl-6-hydroxyphenyl methylase/3-demethylubiquinone-9 3-methyltransferase|tara:strand:+ start:1358 stop:2200 length:843 start_codon:yes stop_codon:yes gene_type:complete
MNEKEFNKEVKIGERFEFGKNWKSFLNSLTDEQIEVAKESLTDMMSIDDLTGKSFLDIGCGSGLFSLSAKMLNAKVHSFDFDPMSVKCARFLNEKFTDNDNNWKIEQGSVLNTEYVKSLSKFDIVYSWGVLHHTGNMELALDNAGIPVKDNGLLFIAIYNDQGEKSRFWLKIKKIYNSSFIGKLAVKTFYYPYYTILGLMIDLFRRKNPFKRYREYRKLRGMSITHDWKDWLGGLPFEVATPDYIIDFYLNRGFYLMKIKSTNRLGCNQFVFKKTEHNIK